MAQKTAAKIICSSFDQPDQLSLNNYIFFCATLILKFLGLVIYHCKGFFKRFPTVFHKPQFPTILLARVSAYQVGQKHHNRFWLWLFLA
jgi:hypothetical protein